MLNENQSAYMPLGMIRRMKNSVSIPPKTMEAQSGNYQGEDDTVLIKDN